jgi:uncharacterized membrane protein
MDPEKTWHEEHAEKATIGEWLADKIASGMGSWTFLIAQTLCIAGWIALNLVAWMHHWDAYPFILLNLLFSTQAAYAAPVIMMSQNRQAARDRIQADHDYQTNLAAKAEIEALQKHLHAIEDQKLDAIRADIEALKAHFKIKEH